MSAVTATEVVTWDPELYLNPASPREALADNLPMFSLDVVGVIAGYLLFTKYVWCGQQTWENLFGTKCIDGVVPMYPREVEKELARDCPFNPGMQVWQTHFLMLFVARINGKPMSTNLMPDVFQKARGELALFPERRKNLKLKSWCVFDNDELKTYWGLVIRSVPGTKSVRVSEQEKFIQARGGKEYQLLSGRDFVQYEFMLYALSGKFPKYEIVRCSQLQHLKFVSTMQPSDGVGIIYRDQNSKKKSNAAAVRVFPQSQEKL